MTTTTPRYTGTLTAEQLHTIRTTRDQWMTTGLATHQPDRPTRGRTGRPLLRCEADPEEARPGSPDPLQGHQRPLLAAKRGGLWSRWLTVGGRNHIVGTGGAKGRGIPQPQRDGVSEKWRADLLGGTSTPWTERDG